MDIKTILYATDFSDTSAKALEMTRKLKDSLSAHVHVLHVFDQEALDMPLPYGMMPGAAAWSGEHMDKVKEAARRSLDNARLELGDCQGHFVEGDPGHEIVAFADANQVDMIILGTHGYRGFRRVLMGSVAEYVLRHTEKPVLTVKGENET